MENSINPKNLFIGTSGWNYKHWRDLFYPKSVSQKNWLEHYSRYFHTVEINNSFYRLPQEHIFQNWYQSTPENFIFSVKANRYITHMKKLKDPEESLKNFIDHIKILNEKLGPVLFQLPPNFKLNSERLELFLKELPQNIRHTIEFRDPAWWNDRTFDLLKKYNIAFCIFELGDLFTPETVTADFVYIRLHGPEERYISNYNEQMLELWDKKIRHWLEKNLKVYMYFDNDANGYAVLNAMRIREMLTDTHESGSLFD